MKAAKIGERPYNVSEGSGRHHSIRKWQLAVEYIIGIINFSESPQEYFSRTEKVFIMLIHAGVTL